MSHLWPSVLSSVCERPFIQLADGQLWPESHSALSPQYPAQVLARVETQFTQSRVSEWPLSWPRLKNKVSSVALPATVLFPLQSQIRNEISAHSISFFLFPDQQIPICLLFRASEQTKALERVCVGNPNNSPRDWGLD